MTHKTMRALFIMIAVVGLFFTACEKSNNPMVNNDDGPDILLDPSFAATTDIICAQSIDVGDINVWFGWDNGTEYVYVQYVTTGDYYLTEVHVQVGDDTMDLYAKARNGNPAPGQFNWKAELSEPYPQTYTVEVPWDTDWDEAEVLYIAAHCVVIEIVDGEPTGWEETGWGEGNDFYGRNWAMWFSTPVQKTLNLPSGEIKITTDRPVWIKNPSGALIGGVPSRTKLSNVPAGYDVTNGYYNSFCLDLHVNIYLNNTYFARLWSSFDPTMPNYAKYNRGTTTPTPYDKINYLINKYYPHPYTGDYASPLIRRLNWCFWIYRGDATLNDVHEDDRDAVESMLEDADANGVGFYPKKGEWLAVIVDPKPYGSIQLLCIEVDP